MIQQSLKMKQYTKKQILQIINESSHNVDEMAYVPNSGKTGKPVKAEKLSKAKAVTANDYDPSIPKTDYPEAWILNPKLEPGGEILLVYTNQEEVNLWMSKPENMKWVEQVMAEKVTKLGETFKIVNWKRVKYFKPNPSDYDKLRNIGIDWPETEKIPISLKEKILRNFIYPKLKIFVQNVNPKLINSGVPPISLAEQTFEKQKQNIDTNMVINNDIVKWRTYTLNYYESYSDFVKSLRQRISGEEVTIEPLITHQPRKYNPGSNWSPTRIPQKMTKSFGVVVGSELLIDGKRTQSGNGYSYEWNLTFIVESGKRSREDYSIENIDRDKVITVTKNTGLIKNVEVEADIASNKLVKETLQKAIDELARKIEQEISPKIFQDSEMLKPITV